MSKRYVVTLTDEERRSLRGLISSGKASARKLARARILLKADSAQGNPGGTTRSSAKGSKQGARLLRGCLNSQVSIKRLFVIHTRFAFLGRFHLAPAPFRRELKPRGLGASSPQDGRR